MNREKREPDYPIQLESQFIIRLPQEPAKVLSDLIKSGENFKNRLKIQINDDMRHGEVRLDHWLLHAKIVDIPTIVESWKTIDRKSLYKSADICQMMICKEELDETTEDEAPSKNKKKDSLKVDKKYLWPHGITPPTKNVRRRRFRKTLRKKCAESPEIEKEVKRLLRADNEAVSFTWEVVQEENEQVPKNESNDTLPKKGKGRKDTNKNVNLTNQSSKVEDIFGGALSDSDVDDDNAIVHLKDSKQSFYEESSETNYIHKFESIKERKEIIDSNKSKNVKSQKSLNLISKTKSDTVSSNVSCDQDNNRPQQSSSSTSGDFDSLLQGVVTELEELKQRRQRTQLEISGLENMTLRQRFQDILKTINKEIIMKEMEYHKLKSRLKSQ